MQSRVDPARPKGPGLQPSGLRPKGRVNSGLQPSVWSNPDPKRGLYSLLATYSLQESLSQVSSSLGQAGNFLTGPGIEPGTCRMISQCTTSELVPHTNVWPGFIKKTMDRALRHDEPIDCRSDFSSCDSFHLLTQWLDQTSNQRQNN